MTVCPDCMTASERAWHTGMFTCLICEARRISRGPACYAAERAGVVTPEYRAELEAAGGEHWLVVHELVRAWRRGERPELPVLKTPTP
ncbi:MAG TPA: hypothetical protein VJO99_25900 [Burkholderiaceae bacterium]|nr:hypothetical protein [Burkholderiaceae bacterium]